MYKTILSEICHKYDVCKDVENVVHEILNPIHPCKNDIINHNYELKELDDEPEYYMEDEYIDDIKFSYEHLNEKSWIDERNGCITNIAKSKLKYEEATQVWRDKDIAFLSENEKNLPLVIMNLIKGLEKKLESINHYIKQCRKSIEEMGFNPDGFFRSQKSIEQSS